MVLPSSVRLPRCLSGVQRGRGYTFHSEFTFCSFDARFSGRVRVCGSAVTLWRGVLTLMSLTYELRLPHC